VTPRASCLKATVCGLIALACQAPETLDRPFNAALVPTCAPWDGSATALFLTEQSAVATYPQPPYWAITIYRSVPDIVGRDFVVSAETQNLGQGQVCPSVGACYPAPEASVSLSRLNADSTVDVRYRFDLTPDSVITGKARARLYPASGMCG
jgi:hypothetical protein